MSKRTSPSKLPGLNPRTTAKLLQQHRRCVAYHEAGHAAMQWLFGGLDNLAFIDMRGNEKVHASVRTSRLNLARLIPDMGTGRKLPKPYRDFIKVMAQQQMMFDLAGPAAEKRVSEPDGFQHWLEPDLELGDFENRTDEDIPRAFFIARAACGGKEKAAYKMLNLMAEWTDEALSNPRFWSAIETLAEELVSVKSRIAGERVIRILDEAWGEVKDPILPGMGPQWQERFAPRPLLV